MHINFIPYGKKDEVDLLLRDMQSQKHWMPMKKKKHKDMKIPIQAQLRVQPFGIYEYVFPKEDLDLVLSTLYDSNDAYKIPKSVLAILRKALHLKKIPEYEKGATYLWIRNNVSIILIGMREDGEIEGKHELDLGWTHEAI